MLNIKYLISTITLLMLNTAYAKNVEVPSNSASENLLFALDSLIFTADSVTSPPPSALDVSSICTKVEKYEDSLISRGSHCYESDVTDIPVLDNSGNEVGTAKVTTYIYSDNQKNQLNWTFKYKFRTTFVGQMGTGLKVRPNLFCYECGIQDVIGAPVNLVPGLSGESTTTITPNMSRGNPLSLVTDLKIEATSAQGTFDNPYYLSNFYMPTVRCDQFKAKSNTSGCVYSDAAPVFTLSLTDADVDESATHIQEAFADGKEGKFIPKAHSSALADSSTNPLTRNKDFPNTRKDYRQISVQQCKVKYGPDVGSTCFFTGDSDEIETPCDCDEYPFAATNQGGSNASVKKIDSSDNRRAGARLGVFFNAERVIHDEEFYVDIKP